MIGRTNVGGGGGAGNTIGYIGVVYPAGSIVTCTKGTKTLTAKDTSGLYVFFIPEVGVWTVTSTDGVNTFTQDVEITTMWQNVVVNVSYWDGELFYNGNQYTNITGGWAYNGNFTYNSTYRTAANEATISDTIRIYHPGNNKCCVVTTGQAIDFTDVESITVTVENSTIAGAYQLGLVPSNQSGGSVDGLVNKFQLGTDAGDKTFDLSSVTGEYFVAIATYYYDDLIISKIKMNFAT